MPLIADASDAYLVEDDVVRWSGTPVADLARRLRSAGPGQVSGADGRLPSVEFARAAYTYVRDAVHHTCDVADPRVTLTAEQVLTHTVGLCYAKSHLLTALLRAEGVPAGLCYQRLGDGEGGHVVHGLIAVWLDGGWHRQDARGNKPGVAAEFSLDGERLAWVARPEDDEVDYPELYVHPHPLIIEALSTAADAFALCSRGLPASLPTVPVG